ncbi:hypothetical protein N8E89_24060 (plasmid) [Phyllobacterium sp. A18/5-2]|uniref:hypothetical protein n=1 Tax=Phyllobacterium sp. A18/5-2 TaxID=2978392 RepID=UPI0021C62B11|nr:hypothetical protein [Phyllobacterium sp. A18/5-2]UXN66255.1 hypothetical protein N8E89_24060 [Phyllobacterium sp. A18/5-2]
MLTLVRVVPVLCSAALMVALVTFDNHVVDPHATKAWARDGDKGGNAGDNKGNGGGRAGNSGNVRGGGKVNQSSPAQRVTIDGSTMEVRHWNGMSERIKDGRYVMKDAKGRIIINRTATTSDQSRMRSFR